VPQTISKSEARLSEKIKIDPIAPSTGVRYWGLRILTTNACLSPRRAITDIRNRSH